MEIVIGKILKTFLDDPLTKILEKSMAIHLVPGGISEKNPWSDMVRNPGKVL